jgi:Tfp pilus assembly protein PilN
MSMTVEAPTGRAVTSGRVDWAMVPRVNLLPPEILAARRFRRTQLMLACVLAGTVLVAGAVTAWAAHDVSAARDDLQTVTARTAALHAQEQRYAEVPKVLAQVDAATAARQVALGEDVLWYRFLDDLAVATPRNVWLGSVTVSQSTGVVATTSDPLTPPARGTVTFSGSALHFPDVASWLTQVGAVHGLDASRLQTAARGADVSGAAAGKAGTVTFTSTIVITSDALSHRYDRKAR